MNRQTNGIFQLGMFSIVFSNFPRPAYLSANDLHWSLRMLPGLASALLFCRHRRGEHQGGGSAIAAELDEHQQKESQCSQATLP